MACFSRCIDTLIYSCCSLNKHNQHWFSGRVEKFSVSDKDQMSADNNNESGKAATFNYSYRINKHLFFHGEYSWLSSSRPSRVTHGVAKDLIEHQFQLALRYFF